MRHGSKIDPPNPFEPYRRELDLEHLAWDQEYAPLDSSRFRAPGSSSGQLRLF